MSTKNFKLPSKADKSTVFDAVESYIISLSLEIDEVDDQRPWGGYFGIAHESEDKFIDIFYSDVDKERIFKHGRNLRPKILILEPEKRLSWQYHNRRAEMWKCLNGPVGVIISETNDLPGNQEILNSGDIIHHDRGIRHRMIGKENWGIVAEIWQHIDPKNPSDEKDIVRLEDDFGRK